VRLGTANRPRLLAASSLPPGALVGGAFAGGMAGGEAPERSTGGAPETSGLRCRNPVPGFIVPQSAGEMSMRMPTDAGSGHRGDRPSRRDPQRVLPRDPEVLGAMLKELEPRLTAVALRMTRDPAIAEDVVQNAFEKALRHGRRFRGDARVSTWMHRIVANEALMWLRGQRRRQSRLQPLADAEGEELADPRPGIHETVAGHQSLRRVWEGLGRLPAEEREVLLRCAVGGRSYGELGAECGVHPAALKSRAFRARRRLHAALEAGEGR